MMEKITESCYEAQDHSALNGITIHLGGYTKTNVNLYVPLAFMIADVPEANDICSFYTVTSKTSGPYRICCACDVTWTTLAALHRNVTDTNRRKSDN